MFRFSDLLSCDELQNKFVHLDVDQSDLNENSNKERKQGQSTKNKKNPKKLKKTKCQSTSSYCTSDNISKQKCQINGVDCQYERFYVNLFGFYNIRNSCFLNATLQLLFNIPSFCGVLHKIKETKPNEALASGNSIQRSLLTLLLKFSELSKNQLNSLGDLNDAGGDLLKKEKLPLIYHLNADAIFEPPSGLTELIQMNSGYQEDVAECLTQILTRLHEELSGDLPSTSTTKDNFDESDWIITDRTGKRHKEARKIELDGGHSPIWTLFCGTLTTRFNMDNLQQSIKLNSVDVCQRNGFGTKEPFFLLPLEINDTKIASVEDALRFLAQPEQVDDYLDSAGNRMANIRRRFLLDRLPKYLIIQLKRFYYHNQSNTTSQQANCDNDNKLNQGSFVAQKNLKSVQIPIETIIPKELLSQETHFTLPERQYQLLAVIFHIGQTASSGHYTIAIRQPHCKDASFVYVDDQQACCIKGNLHQLLNTHCPLDIRSKTFSTVPKHQQSPGLLPSLALQPRTPYIVVYESHTIIS